MKVLMFANIVSSRLGAYEEFLAALAEKCSAAGDICVTAVGGAPAGPVASRWRAAGLMWETLDGWTDRLGVEHPWQFLTAAIPLIKRHLPDVVSVRFGNEAPACAVAVRSRYLRSKKIRWIWEQDQQIATPGFLARHVSRIRLVAGIFDHIVTVSETSRRILLLRKVPAEKISVIHNGVAEQSLSRRRGWLREEIGASDTEVLVGMISSLIPRKRVDVALRAVAAVSQPRLRLIIAGEGPQRQEVQSLAVRLQIAERVHFLGVRSDAREIMTDLDIFLHTSAAEGCSFAIAEAMASSLPVVAAEAGAASEQVEDGVTGFVVPVGDEKLTAERLQRLASDAELRRKFGKRGRDRWNDLFRLEEMVRRYHRLYCQTGSG